MNVLPYLAKGMVRVAREQPEDPIAFLADLLMQQASETQALSEASAFSKFSQLLEEAENREVERNKTRGGRISTDK